MGHPIVVGEGWNLGFTLFHFYMSPTLASIIVIIQIVFFFGEPNIQIVSTNLLETFFFLFCFCFLEKEIY